MVFQKGNIPWNKGKGEYLPREVREKINKMKIRQMPWWIKRGLENPSKTDKVKKILREKAKKYKNPMLGKHHTDNAKDKIGNASNNRWKDSKFRERFFRGIMNAWKGNVKPNKKELITDSLIHIITNDYKYNGDFSQGVTIGGKIPDWINVNGEKKVIELFGRPFHDPNSSFIEVRDNRTYNRTMEHYKKYGFNCLIIWDNELKEPGKVLKKIYEFDEGGDINQNNVDDK